MSFEWMAQGKLTPHGITMSDAPEAVCNMSSPHSTRQRLSEEDAAKFNQLLQQNTQPEDFFRTLDKNEHIIYGTDQEERAREGRADMRGEGVDEIASRYCNSTPVSEKPTRGHERG